MSVAPLLKNNLDNSKQKTSNLLSPAPPPYSWSLLGIVEGPAPPPSSKISRSFDLAWNPDAAGLLSWCLTSTEARWPIRDGDRVGRGRESERLDRGNRPKKTGETVDRRQNNGSVKVVSPRHCPATCALAAIHGLSGLFRAVSAVEPSLFRPLPPLSPSLINRLASVVVKQNGPGPKNTLQICKTRLDDAGRIPLQAGGICL